MKAKLIKTEVNYLLENQEGVIIASTSVKKEGWELSLKNCEAIECGYDLDELAEKVATMNTTRSTQNWETLKWGIKIGFQKALELMGDKKFSEEDMIREILIWDNHINIHEEDKGCIREISQRVKSLQQTEWDVEVEMECPQCQEYGYISECRNNCNKRFLQPKLDADGCLILKRVI